LKKYEQKYPAEFKELQARMQGNFAEQGWQRLLPSKERLPKGEQPTRKSSGIAVQALVPHHKSFVAGSADLLESTFVNFNGQVEFQNVSQLSRLPPTFS
jgi:dihydroxyacetone synthase